MGIVPNNLPSESILIGFIYITGGPGFQRWHVYAVFNEDDSVRDLYIYSARLDSGRVISDLQVLILYNLKAESFSFATEVKSKKTIKSIKKQIIAKGFLDYKKPPF
jgi:hypothetical protein